MIDVFALGRPAGDILGRVARIVLTGTTYELPVLPIAGNKRWKAQLDDRLTGLLNGLEQSGENVSTIFALLNGQVDDLVALLYAYDEATTSEGVPYHPPVLPERAVLEETVYEDELVAAVREVWRAANPLVATALAAMEPSEVPMNGSSEPTSSPPQPTATAPRKRSRKA